MTPLAEVLSAELAATVVASGAYLIRERMHLRAARDGVLTAATGLGPAQEDTAETPAVVPAVRLAPPGPVLPLPAGAKTWTGYEVARYLQVDPRTVTRWAESGHLDAVRDYRGHRVYTDASVQARKAAMNGGPK